ncbi:cysteine-rich VLP domain-containing protein, partial [Enterocloster clostridioformis]
MSKKIPGIERTPGGGLPRMTPAQRRRANALIRKTCCNYDNGNCLLLDDGEECVCPQSISYSVCCKWFRWAVLPQDKALEAEIFRSASVKRCAECGAAFVP